MGNQVSPGDAPVGWGLFASLKLSLSLSLSFSFSFSSSSLNEKLCCLEEEGTLSFLMSLLSLWLPGQGAQKEKNMTRIKIGWISSHFIFCHLLNSVVFDYYHLNIQSVWTLASLLLFIYLKSLKDVVLCEPTRRVLILLVKDRATDTRNVCVGGASPSIVCYLLMSISFSCHTSGRCLISCSWANLTNYL